MNLSSPQRKGPDGSRTIEQLLADRYAQFLRWAMVLARGDRAKAEEVVQEFCLYFAQAKPDLGGVNNLDGYLYTCLRHIYISSLARASRDALRMVSLEEYDSFALVLSQQKPGDPLQQQNDLRRVCNYVVWRKESSKTASYFILHFFHGYGRQEVAEVAQVPMATIYNKLKSIRAEVHTYLNESGKLRVLDRQEPPAPALSWQVMPPAELFAELRSTILQARSTQCLPEAELAALYLSHPQIPIPCALLAHIVSCERCLALVDGIGRRPTLKDREPLDAFGYSPREGEEPPRERVLMTSEHGMLAVQRKLKRVKEHRPRTLSIALNGEVIATHDVRSEHSRLSARIDAADHAQFVEVFSEQDVRLVLLPVEAASPERSAEYRQRVSLSDDRWVELNLRFDGLGLHSEVLYFDPTLAQVVEEEQEVPASYVDSKERERGLSWLAAARRRLRLFPTPAVAWALLLLVAAGLGSWIYLRQQVPLRATAVLKAAVQQEALELRGQTVHQVVRLEETSSTGATQLKGTVDLWKDGDGGRYARRLYDDQHRLIAAQWRSRHGREGNEHASLPQDPLISRYWTHELSAQAFAGVQDAAARIRAVDSGYEITRMGALEQFPQLISATLVLDRRYKVIEQRLQVRFTGGMRQLRFIQESYEHKPARSVPDAIFVPQGEYGSSSRRGRSSLAPRALTQGNSVQLAELEIGILYALRTMGVDTGIPIEVSRTPGGRVRVAGSVATASLKHAIEERLRSLEDAQLLDLNILAVGEMRGGMRSGLRSAPIEAYEVTQTKFAADIRVRHALEERGLEGEALNHAVTQFSLDVLSHAQKALQHAYALDRLGNAASSEELPAADIQSQREWTEMVRNHASAVHTELRAMQELLAGVWPLEPGEGKPDVGAIEITDPAQYAKAARRLLEQVRTLNQRTGELFTANGRASEPQNLDTMLQAITGADALFDSQRLADFAARLSEAENGKKATARNE